MMLLYAITKSSCHLKQFMIQNELHLKIVQAINITITGEAGLLLTKMHSYTFCRQ
jgi:hypothetical protein